MNPYVIALLAAIAVVGTILAIVAMYGGSKASEGKAETESAVLKESARKRKEAEDAAAAERKRLEEELG